MSNPFSLKSTASAALMILCADALALPTGGKVVEGTADVKNSAVDMQIVQRTDKAIINWEGFSIGAKERVSISQPTPSAVLLNRVLGNNPSVIEGKMVANGAVFLVNPAGVLFTKGSQVSAASIVASTLDMANSDFMKSKGVYRFDASLRDSVAGSVVNHGTLRANTGGTVALLGGAVSNNGIVAAQMGTAVLAAGSDITLDFAGDGLTKVKISGAIAKAFVDNEGMVVADSGQVLMSASNADALAGTVINQQGIVQARSVARRGGRIVLDGGDNGLTLVSGTLDATGAGNLQGGSIDVTGHDVALLRDAHLYATGGATTAGAVAGGQVRIGGGAGGADGDLRNAQTVTIDPYAEIRADASGLGAGGRIAIYGAQSARIFGTLSADGGASGGNGGLIDTSARYLDASYSNVAANAVKGSAGTWVLDAFGLRVVPDPSESTNPARIALASSSSLSEITASAISRALTGGTSVVLRTGFGNIAQGGNILIDGSIRKSAAATPSDVTLAFDASGGITSSQQSINANPNSGVLNLVFHADGLRQAPELAFVVSPSLGTAPGVMLYGVALTTNGGDASISGPVVVLDDTHVDTRAGALPNAPSGDVSVLADGKPASTIIVNRSSIETSTGSIDMRANGGGLVITSRNSDGLPLPVGSKLSTGSGAIRLYGFTQTNIDAQLAPFPIISRGGNTFPARRAGVLIYGADISTAEGVIDIRGRASAPDDSALVYDGVGLFRTSIATLGGPSGTIAISGQATGGGAGVYARNTDVGSQSEQGDVILRALNEGARSSIDLSDLTSESKFAFAAAAQGTNRFTTLSRLVAVPAGVDAANGFALTADDAIPITLGARTGGMSFDQIDLSQLSGANTLIFGGNTHTGAITVANAAPFTTHLTLANSGGGSMGIVAPKGISAPGKTLTLMSSGSVEIDGPIIANALLLAGPASYDLSNPDNSVNVFAASGVNNAHYVNAGPLIIGSMRSPTYTTGAADGQFQTIDAGNTTVAHDLLVESVAGGIQLGGGVAQSVGPTGAGDTNVTAGDNIDLVMDGKGAYFTNAGAGRLMTQDAWRVWADTWVGESRGANAPGGVYPNYYGCTFHGGCSWPGSVEQNANRFVYASQPTATVTIGDQTRDINTQNLPFDYSVAGLVNHDRQANALDGQLSTTAGQDAPKGTYAIDGTFTSPVGYRVVVMPGKLTVMANAGSGSDGVGTLDPGSHATGNQSGNPGNAQGNGKQSAPSTGDSSDSDFFAATGLQSIYSDSVKSFVYETNLDGATTRGGVSVCAGSNQPIASNVPADAAEDTLALEWRRVRSQPNLNNCIVVNRQHGCGDF